jgi:hypothetical protein
VTEKPSTSGETDEVDEVDQPAEQSRDPKDLPGVHRLVGGAIIAVLAPLFGFLGGSVSGADTTGEKIGTLYYWLVAGLVIGSIGAVIAFMGGLRLQRSLRRRPVEPPR